LPLGAGAAEGAGGGVLGAANDGESDDIVKQSESATV
jgi:hypothetical protein